MFGYASFELNSGADNFLEIERDVFIRLLKYFNKNGTH